MITVALIGYGYWGPNIARNINNNKNFNLKYICDKDINRIEMARKLYGDAIDYSKSFDDILEDPEINAVAIAVGTKYHYPLVKQALLAGKHVYVEKPFTDNVKDAIELRDLAQHKGLVIHVDHLMVYHPAIRLIKKYIDSGELGKILYFDCSRLNLGNVVDDVSSMWDLSVHDLSIIDYLSNGATVKFVRALGDQVYGSKETLTFLLVQYSNFVACIRSNWISPIKERKLILAGDKKMLVYDDVEVVNKLIIYDKGFETLENLEYDEYVVKARVGDAIAPHFEGGADALYNSLEHFRECIIQGKESISDANAAIRIIQILELADQQLLLNKKEV